MSDQIKRLDCNEVVCVENSDKFLVQHTTFKAKEFLESIKSHLRAPEGWINEGVKCEVMSPGEGWRKGGVRISLEFYPDEPDVIEIPVGDKLGTTQPESLLDDIRQITVEGN